VTSTIRATIAAAAAGVRKPDGRLLPHGAPEEALVNGVVEFTQSENSLNID
jgi:hypothetical protein